MIIDFHTHCFPDALAEKALGKLSAIGNLPTHSDGTAAGTLAKMDACGIDRAVVLNIATNDRQTANVNRFAIETSSGFKKTSALCSSSFRRIEDILAGLSARCINNWIFDV